MVDGAKGPHLVSLPAVESLRTRALPEVLTAARRSLLARGLAVNGESSEHLVPTEELAAVLAVRRGPSMVAIADRHGGEISGTRYLYGAGTAIVLEERLELPGCHRFVLRTLATASAELAAFADPEGSAGFDDEAVVRRGADIPAGWERFQTAMKTARHVTNLYVVRQDQTGRLDEVHMSVVSAADGVWAVSGYLDPDGGPAEVGAKPVSRGVPTDSAMDVPRTSCPVGRVGRPVSGLSYSERVGVTPLAALKVMAVLDGPVLLVAAVSGGPVLLRAVVGGVFLLGTVLMLALANRRRYEIDSDYLHVGRRRLPLSDIVEVDVVPVAEARGDAWGFRSFGSDRVNCALWTDEALRLTVRSNWEGKPPWRWRPLRWYLGSRNADEFRSRLEAALSSAGVGRQLGHHRPMQD